MVKLKYATFKYAAAAGLFAICLLFCACNISADSSLKELTDPYITQYECTYAHWGETDFLEGFEYIRITLTDANNMELSYKKKGEKEHKHNCSYEYDEKTGELKAQSGALGIEFKESVIIKEGKFTIALLLMGRELIMKFES